MQQARHVGVTTTQSIEGWEIEEYLGPVVVHTVAGVGLMSEWLAGWSDLFGGRSGAYGKQLRSLSDEALQSLRARAASIKANWVLGVTVDMDEISGQNKQMLMITAMGTAVRARSMRIDGAGVSIGDPSGGRLSADQVKAADRRRRLLSSLEKRSVVFDDETWTTLMEERIADAVPYVVSVLARAQQGEANLFAEYRAKAVAFLERLDPAEASRHLHAALDREEPRPTIAFELIKEVKLRDLGEIRRRLEGDAATRPQTLQLLAADQLFYEPADADALAAIEALCADDRFPRAAKLVPGKGGLFGGGDMLQCLCGAKRPATQSRCTEYTCQRDERGFRPTDITPDKARDLSASLSSAIKFAFSTTMS